MNVLQRLGGVNTQLISTYAVLPIFQNCVNYIFDVTVFNQTPNFITTFKKKKKNSLRVGLELRALA